MPSSARLRQLTAILRHLRYERRPLSGRPIAELSTNQANPADAVRWMGPVTVAGDTRYALFCHPASTAAFTTRAEPGARVAVSCALLPDVWDRNTGGVTFSVRIEGATGRVCASSVTIDPRRRAGDRRWRPIVVPIRLAAPQDITVAFETRLPPGAAGDYAWAVWGDPVLEQPRPGRSWPAVVSLLARRILRQGLRPAVREVATEARRDPARARYQAWFAAHAPSPSVLAALAADAERLPTRPVISILTPVYNTPPEFLKAAAASVLAQTYPHWEWCLCNDASTSSETLDALRSLSDSRIRVIHLERNAGISAATQAALEVATGDFIALLDHDDELTPDALSRVAARLNETPALDLIYSDEDKRDEDGGLSEPYFKPDWSPEHLLSAMYTCHLTVARRALVRRAGGFRTPYDGAQDHDLALRLSELTDRIDHLPAVLYHWRRAPASSATAAAEKPWADDAGRKAVGNCLERRGVEPNVDRGEVPGVYRPRFPVRHGSVLLLVLGDDRAAAEACLSSLREVTNRPGVIAVVALPVSAEINALVAEHAADDLVCIDAAVDVADDDWLDALLEFSQQTAIGACGGKVQYADGRLRHIGLLLGVGGGVARAMHQHPGASYGCFSSAVGIRNYSAVSGELFASRRQVWTQVGGFDEALPWIGADVDYCLKARRAGLRVVFTPYARARLRPGATPGQAAPTEETIQTLRARWPAAFERDPYFNPNLSLASGDYELP